MCGIAGGEKAEQINRHQQHRGTSQKKTGSDSEYSIAHTLHSIVGCVEQPLESEFSTFTGNCEIYNWQKLAEKHNLEPSNDADLLHKLLDKKGMEALKELDGVYAFAYVKKDKVYLARDKLGVKPLWHTKEENFHFASEKQALEKEDLVTKELHPRHILVYDIQTEKISYQKREFFKIDVNDDKDIDQVAEEIKNNFLAAVEKRIPKNKEVGLLFSGGVDSTMVAAALKELDKDFTCYTSGIQHGNVNAPRDVEWAEKIAEKMDLKLETEESDLEQVEKILPEISDWLSTTSTVKLGVALPFHLALQGEEKVVFSGLGSEQLYAGYHRQQGYLNKECLSDLRQMYHVDLYRDDVISMRNGYELRVPFLDQNLVEHALKIPEDFKKSDEHKKYVLRLAAEKLGVPEEVAWRKKTAAQYGSNFDKAITRISKNKGFSHKQQYLNSLRDKPNNRILGLTSGGKDSCAAIYRLKRRNNQIVALLNIRSDNKQSYMFDVKKGKDAIQKQAKALKTPLIIQRTPGEKEKELKDLQKGIQKAKKKYNVEGIVTGAIASTYQRDRVDKIAEETGLKTFAPLWQENPQNYMRWLIREGFKIKITDVAARGLTEEWIGKTLDQNNIEKLLDLSDKYRFNPAGEGGEFETLVIEMPNTV